MVHTVCSRERGRVKEGMRRGANLKEVWQRRPISSPRCQLVKRRRFKLEKLITVC